MVESLVQSGCDALFESRHRTTVQTQAAPVRRAIPRRRLLPGDVDEVGDVDPGFAEDALCGGDAQPVQLAVTVDDPMPARAGRA
jgi:hypothetical protein